MPELVSFSERVAQIAVNRPDAIAITVVSRDGSTVDLSWIALDRWANRTARLFARHGIGPGDWVVIGLGNGLSHLVVTIAAWRCGAYALPLSPRAPDREFNETAALVEHKLIVADRPGAPLRTDDILAARHDARLADSPLPAVPPRSGKAIASGGSTGRPKIIVDPRPWARVPGEIEDLRGYGFASGGTQLVAGPLYHNSPFGWAHYGLFEGSRLVVMERFDAAAAVDLTERFGCTFTFLAPTMMQRIIRLPDIASRDLSSIKAVFHSAAICPPWLKQAWIELIGPDRLFESFGSSEAIGHTCITGREWLDHPGSVGRAQGCELRILDTGFRELPPGEIGEIFFRPGCHPLRTFAYVGAPPAKTTPDGFISVGDMGHVDAEGWLFIADRRTDLIISGGANVYPAEVEAALTEHPGVSDAAVVGLLDDEWGRRVHAIVELAQTARPPSADELMMWLRARLAPYKLPKAIEFLSRLPRDPSGKIRRSALVEERTSASAGAAR